MNMNEYQKGTLETWGGDYRLQRTLYGITGEAGECAEVMKKFLRGDYDDDTMKEKLIKELGDVLYYVSVCAHELDVPLSVIAQDNYMKLKSRNERGVIKGEGDER